MASVLTAARRRSGALTPTSAGSPLAPADLTDLFVLALRAGCTVGSALALIAERLPGPSGASLRRLQQRVERGEPLADALAAMPALLGRDFASLADALMLAVRYGTPIESHLERVAVEGRLAERRAVETRARRVPLLLLFPLVMCSLPAFVLLTILPLTIAALARM